jgi:hypothetical protein
VLPPDCADAYERDEKARHWRRRGGPYQQSELLVAISDVARRSSTARDAALLRLRGAEKPALIAAFWFSQGMLWRQLGATASGADEASNAARQAAMSFQAATEVVDPQTLFDVHISRMLTLCVHDAGRPNMCACLHVSSGDIRRDALSV